MVTDIKFTRDKLVVSYSGPDLSLIAPELLAKMAAQLHEQMEALIMRTIMGFDPERELTADRSRESIGTCPIGNITRVDRP